MKILYCCMLLCMEIGNTFGLSCFSCNSYDFDGETTSASRRSCYFSDKHTNVNQHSCASDTTTNKYYCRTQVRLYDGMPNYVNRGCVSTSSDEDQSTMEMPSSDKCILDITTYSDRDTTRTNCYFHCYTSGCNNISISSLKPCNSDCGRNANRGYCDYISGRCICNNGMHRNICTEQDLIINTRKCVQCTSELDSGCQNKTMSSDCPSGQNYCSAVYSTTYDSDGNIARTVFTKSCTSSFPRYECKMSEIYHDAGINSVGYFEYICYLICAEDDCNTNINMSNIKSAVLSPAGALDCQRCRGTWRDCSSSGNVRCPADATHCISTVVYVIDEHNFSDSTTHRIISTVRDCATSNVTTGCKKEKIGESYLTRITCQETCQGNGCNIGWPARPKCHQCSSDNYYGSTYCSINFDHTLRNCLPNQEYCTVQQTTTTHPSGMPAFKITRSCSYNDIGNSCSSYVRNNVTIKTCNQTCTTDGCNSGYVDAGEFAQGVVAVFLP